MRPRDLDGREVRRVLIEEENVPLNEPCSGHWAMLRNAEGEIYVAPVGDYAAIDGVSMF